MGLGVVILVLLLFCSAFFSGMESAYLSLGEIDRIEIENSRRKNRKLLLHLLEHKEQLLSTLLLGNNLVNIGASALSTALAIEYAIRESLQEELVVSITALGLTLVILIFGEITPKNICLIHNRSLALATAPVIYLLDLTLRPFSFSLVWFSKHVSRWVSQGRDLPSISEDTVINVVSKGQELGVINQTERDLIQNVFQFDEREVYPIITPRTSVFALDERLTLAEVRQAVMEKEFSRIPIYGENIDDITGVVHYKAILKALLEGKEDLKIKELAQKPLFIYETLTLSNLLAKFQAEQNHIAIVVDEFGGMSGMVTLEDLLEELVGEIYDEKDQIKSEMRQTAENRWLALGSTEMVTLKKELPGEIHVDGDFETVQGLIMSVLERMPKVGDSIYVEPHRFTVLKMNQNEIINVRIEYQPPSHQGYNED